MLKASADQVAWRRLRRSGLIEPFSSAEDAARGLIGIQAQVLASAGLQLSMRVPGFTATALEQALYEERGLVKLWGQRRTLHLYVPEDWPPLHSLFEDRETWAGATVRKMGGDVEELVQASKDAVDALNREGGTLTRKTLLELRPELAPYLNLGIGLFMDMVQRGAACHARPVGSESHFSHREHWLPDLKWSPQDRASAGVHWTRRYLSTYGPATQRDVAFWMGVKAADARAWLAALAGETAEVDVDGTPHLMLEADAVDIEITPPPRAEWPLRLLHRYDVLVLAHRDKSWIVDEPHYKQVWRKAGVVDAVILVAGRIAGVWRYHRRSKELDVFVRPFGRLTRRVRAAIRPEAQRVAEHFGLVLGSLEFE